MAAADKIASRFSEIKHVVLVLSGKGGVGKSTVATQLAVSLAHNGAKVSDIANMKRSCSCAQVGLLDIDLCGPSIPTMLGITGKSVHSCSEGYNIVVVRFSALLADGCLSTCMTKSWRSCPLNSSWKIDQMQLFGVAPRRTVHVSEENCHTHVQAQQ